jgi:glycosyltransferase involved in cell wall biosynthesis
MVFRTGFETAMKRGADIIVNIDGDGQFNPANIADLIKPVVEGRADFATCSRFAKKELVPVMPTIKRWGNGWMALIVSAVTGHRFYDVSCGFRAYRRETALRLNLFGAFTYTQETFLDLAFKGFRILEVPLRVRGEREFGQSRVASSVLRYAVNSARIIFRSYRDYRPLQVFGALSAWCLLAALVLLGIFGFHYVTTGRFSGQLWAGFTGGAFGFLGVVFMLVGIVADMLDRIRLHQERILYYQKRMLYLDEGQGRDGTGDGRKPPRR